MGESYSFKRKRDFDNLFSIGLKLLKDYKNLKACRNGIYVLKNLAISNPLYTQKCIDTLCTLNERWMPIFIEMFPDFFYINSGFQKKPYKELLLYDWGKNIPDEEKYVFTHPEMKIFLDDILLSQLVINSLSEIFKYISCNDNFRGPYDLSHKYLCSIDLSYFNSNRKFVFYYSFLNSADFEEADLQYSNFYKADLQYADFSKSLLDYSILSYANLYYNDFWCADIKYSDLSYSNLSSSSLRAANLKCSNLAYANLENTSLKYTKLKNANLYRANLQNSKLLHTLLDYADLTFADFREARIHYTYFKYTNVAKANFVNADFERVNFKYAKNADSAIYYDM